jgi:hypothetical protein
MLAAVMLAACATPSGRPAQICDGTWRGIDSVIATRGDGDTRPLPVTCIREVDVKRIRIGFSMPHGPSCYVLDAVQVVESSEAVSVRLMVRPDDDPASGACPDEAVRVTTEVDLQAPVADREVLDAAQP